MPDLLRGILEETLSQDASPASLDRFLPRIRDIIINLLHGLKRKQQRLRTKQAKEYGGSSISLASTGSTGSSESGLTQMLEMAPPQQPSSRAPGRRQASDSSNTLIPEDSEPSVRISSAHVDAASPARQDSGSSSNSTAASVRGSYRDSERAHPTSAPSNSVSREPMQIGSTFQSNTEVTLPNRKPSPQTRSAPFPPPPPPPPSEREQDAFAALQRGGDLERRASRRYSAYQISKHLGASPNGLPMLPPTQSTPIPNRGRDVRESMNAVRTRGSGGLQRQKSTLRTAETSPRRMNSIQPRISEESDRSSDAPVLRPPAEPLADDSPIAKTPEDKLRQSHIELEREGQPMLHATLKGPPSNKIDGYSTYELTDDQSRAPPWASVDDQERNTTPKRIEHPIASIGSSPETQEFIPEDSPQPGKELTLFLQYKSKIKKFVLPDGYNDLSLARLQLAFIEKFAWNTHNHGIDLPEIYLQDPVSGVRHELEDLGDVKERSVLVLNVEALDEVKKHIDEGIGGLRRIVEGVRSAVEEQHSAVKQVSDRQQDTSREIARLAATKPAPVPRVSSLDRPNINGVRSSSSSIDNASQITEVKSLRRDLAVVRQTYSSFVSDFTSSMSELETKALSVRTLATKSALPAQDNTGGRAYVNAGKKTLGEHSEKIVNRVDDLQDLVEDLRKDVVTRGVRPVPRQLETVSKDISIATAELKKMQEYLKREKPIWTKIWEKELEVVCTDRELLTMQEELAADLEDDLEKATETFALVEQATKQQNLQQNTISGSVSLRSTSRGLSVDTDIDPMKAKDGVLGEVRALQPNHETRLEAIERAEKARQIELENRREGEFKKELGSFVEEGKLKRSGGVEEAERLRKVKDDNYRREGWEKQQMRDKLKGKEREDLTPAVQEDEINGESGRASPELEFKEAQEQPPVLPDIETSDQGELMVQKFCKCTRLTGIGSSGKRSSWLPAIFSG